MKAKETEPLNDNNLNSFREHLKATKHIGDYEGILALLADVADSAANGSECYAVFGLNRNRDSIMLTVTIGREKLYATGPSLVAVSKAALDLL